MLCTFCVLFKTAKCNVSEPQESLNQKEARRVLVGAGSHPLPPPGVSSCGWVGSKITPFFGGTKDKLWHFQSESRSPHTFLGQPLDSIRVILESRVLPAADTLLPGTHCQCWTQLGRQGEQFRPSCDVYDHVHQPTPGQPPRTMSCLSCQQHNWVNILSVCTLRRVGCGFNRWPGQTKYCENGTHCLPAWHSVFGVGNWHRCCCLKAKRSWVRLWALDLLLLCGVCVFSLVSA